MTLPRVKAQLLLAGLLVVLAGASLRGNVVSSLEVSDYAVVVNVPIDIVGADPATVRRWSRAIERTWNLGNDGRGYAVCGRAVRVNPSFTLLPEARASRTSHLVVVQEIAPGQERDVLRMHGGEHLLACEAER